MKKKFLHIAIVAIVAAIGTALPTSCYEDKGNYTYHELDEVVIDTANLGIQTAYVVSRYDTIEISPKIYFNGHLVANEADAPSLSYVWTLYIATTSANSDYKVDTLGTSLHLKEAIKRGAGSYYVLLTVTNSNDGTQQYFKVSCSIEESITAGWMMLYETANDPTRSDVGLVVNPWVKKNIIKNREFFDLYRSSNGESLQGAPVRILHTTIGLSADEVVIVTDRDMVGVNVGTFEKIINFGEFFYSAPAVCAPTFYGTGTVSGRLEVIINDNKVHFVSHNALSRTTFFGIPIGGDYGTLAPWASDTHAAAFAAVVYDQTAGRFLYLTSTAVKLANFAPQVDTAPFDVNNVGAELVMGDWGMTYHDRLIFRSGSNYYLGVANFYSATATTNNVGQGWYDITASPGIAQATTMAAAFSGIYVLYGSGSNVYNLKYASSTTADVLWTAPAGEEVTCVRLQKFYFTTLQTAMLPNAQKVMHVATWNESRKEGKLYQFEVNPASGEIVSLLYEYTVPGKIRDMAWKKAVE
ncbi:MAG: hypothetical protein LBR67_05965 [Dysgonamonadaceae bacterium]|jgi:hypothetical protein|nr:hypothetical protein [Dysgonamonadaceae bacterium]